MRAIIWAHRRQPVNLRLRQLAAGLCPWGRRRTRTAKLRLERNHWILLSHGTSPFMSLVELDELDQVALGILQGRKGQITIAGRLLDKLNPRGLQALPIGLDVVAVQGDHVPRAGSGLRPCTSLCVPNANAGAAGESAPSRTKPGDSMTTASRVRPDKMATGYSNLHSRSMHRKIA